MARHRKKHKSRQGRAIPIAPLLPVAGVAIGAYKSAGGVNMNMVNALSQSTIGYSTASNKLNIPAAVPFWGAMVAAVIVHKVASNPKLGVNRLIKKATLGLFML
jgi:hypothetical protein